MDSERWQEIQDLFHEASEVSATQQPAFLRARCNGDYELFQKVGRMLENDRRGSFLDREILPIADEVLGEPEALPFDTVGPYRILEKIGEGGMGLVYRAQRDDWRTSVAIKFPRDTWISRDRLERFSAEQRLLAQLTHPAIARIYQAGTLASGTPWFAMEYIDGEPITRYCQVRGCRVEQRLRLFRAVCEAVQYAHSQTIVHRDLKPSNILVNAAGEIKLLDFGIAKQLEESREVAHRTRTGQQPMTMGYAAPEQVLENRVGTHTDVYSLGVVLYELITGKLPFDMSGLTPSQVEEVMRIQEPDRPSLVVRRDGLKDSFDVSKSEWADLDVLVLTAMHKDVEKRYPSVDALKRDIDHFLRQEPLDAQPDTVRYLLGKFVRRRRQAVITVAAVLAIVVGLVSFFTYRLAMAKDAAVAEAARRARVQKFMTDLFQGGESENGPAKDLRAITLIDRGLEKAHEFDNDPQVQGDLYDTLGTIYQDLGQEDKADSLLRSALKKRVAGFGANSVQAAETTVGLGLLRADEDHYPEAESLVRKGLAIARSQTPRDELLVAKYETALGNVLMRSGANRAAIEVLNQAMPVLATSKDSASLYGDNLTLLVGCHYNLGEYAEAESLSRLVIANDRKFLPSNNPGLATDLMNLASIESDLGQYRDAEQNYRKALALFEAWYGKGHPESADAMRLVAQTLAAEGRDAEAVPLARQALRDEEKVYGPVHTRVALALGVLGRLALKAGALDEAKTDFNRELQIYRSTNKQYIGVALSDLGAAYRSAKDYGRAEQLYKDAIRQLLESYPASHWRVGRAQMYLGETLLADKRYGEAETPLETSYQIWLKQKNRDSSVLKPAGLDLIELYRALHRPEKVEQLRRELANAKVSG